MNKSPTATKSSSEEALILIADVEGSSHTAAPELYIEMVREFHKISSAAISRYLKDEQIAGSDFFHRAYGDEVLVILKRNSVADSAKRLLHIAVMLDVEWLGSNHNRNRRENTQNYCRIRIGIGLGRLSWAESVWGQGVTPEGYGIVRTKRIESRAGDDMDTDIPHILVMEELRADFDAVGGVALGGRFSISGDAGKGIEPVKVFHVEKYDYLYELYSRAIRAEKDALGWYNKGYVAAVAGDHELAVQAFDQASKLRPNDHMTLYNWGLSLGRLALQKQGAEAETLYREAGEKFAAALQAKPDYYEALIEWGFAIYHLAKRKEGGGADGLYIEACGKFAAALQIKPDSHDALNSWGAVLHNLARQKQGSEAAALFKEAGEKFAAALRINPAFHKAQINWANLLYDEAKLKPGAEADALTHAAGEKLAAALQI